MHAVITPTPTGPLVTAHLMLPEHWACRLINGDDEGIYENEERVIALIEKLYGPCCGTETEPEFRRYHDASADGIPAAMCIQFVFQRPHHTEE